MNSKFTNRRNLLALGVAVIVLILGYIYIQNKNGNPILPGGKPNVVAEDQALVLKVGKLILLPQNETPQIATVSDKTKLADQSFFANAENGDKVLLFYGAKKAILYRPSTNKIVEVGPLNVPTETIAPTQISSPSATPTKVQGNKVTPEVPPPIK